MQEDHLDAYRQTGFWGKAGAGCLMVARTTGRILIAKRADWTLDPLTWATWGGAVDHGETPEQAVIREVSEEAGYHGHLSIEELYVFRHESGFAYHNFLALVPEEFQPDFNKEICDCGWFNYGEWPEPLHYGIEAILNDPRGQARLLARSREFSA